ncbi:MAG: hypothetical protein K6G03_02885, partial [Lachnospiraceae bacterium]|nr:hypothetical protein [Lachnospiraceae bacterium]
AMLLGIAISSICTFAEGISTGKFTYNYVEMFEFVTTTAVFLLIKYAVVRLDGTKAYPVLSSAACFLGPLTFGIYLLDPFLKVLFFKGFNSFAEPLLPTLIVSFIWVLISMTFGGLLTFMIKKIPGFDKLL